MSYAMPMRAYWNARAQACRGMADEGACLARVARHEPVTIGGLGQIRTEDIASAAGMAAQIITNPDATLRAQGPRIVAALDQHVVGPLVETTTQRSIPYLVRYLGPPMILLYIMTAVSTWASYQVLLAHRTKLAANRRRRRRH